MTRAESCTPSHRLTAAAILGLSMAMSPLMPLAAIAQEGQGLEAPATSYDDATLARFVEAAVSVSEVRDSYAPRMAEAETEDAARALAEDAVADMREAVAAVPGIDINTYMAIGTAAESDTELAGRISDIARDMGIGR